MADIVEQAIGEITVKDNTAAGIASASANFQRLYNVVRYNWWGIQNLGRAFAAVGGVIAAGLGEATKATIDFQQGLAQAQRTGQLTAEQTQQLGDALRKMALTKPIGVDQLTQIATAAGQLGINGVTNIEKFTGVIADMINTTDLTAQSAEQLAKLAGPLGIAGDDWSRLGSTILTMGIHTAATETEIIKVAQQLAGVGSAANISTPQIIGMSAVIASIGTQSSSAATGISRLVSQIATAATGQTQKAKDQFATFAHVAGYDGPAAVKRFAASFNQDAGPAIAQFIAGIGTLKGHYTEQNAILRELGITETREVRAITTVGAAQEQTANKSLRMTYALREAEAAWQRNTALQSQAQKLYGTTANQLKILENTVHDIAISFGGDLAKALGLVLKPIADLLYGFDQLPSGVKTGIDVIAALSAGLLLTGAAASSLAQRFVLVRGSLLNLGEVVAGAKTQAQALVYAMNEQAAAEGRVADASALSAGKLSTAKKQEILETQAATNAARIEAAQQADVAAAQDQRAISAAAVAEQEAYAAEATQKRIAADVQAEEASALAAKGLDDEALAASTAAEQLLAEAEAADAAAAAAANIATAAEEEAAALDAAALAAGEAAAAEIASAEAATEASGAMYLLGAALDAATGPFAAIFIGITAVTAALGIWGAHQRNSLDLSEQQATANDQLAQAIYQSGSATSAAVVAYYNNNDAFLKLAASTEQYGISLINLLNIITGVAGAGATAQLAALKAQAEAGNSGARDTYNQIAEQINIQRASIIQSNEKVKAQREEAAQGKATGAAADQQTAAERRLGAGTDSATKSSQAHTQALEKEKQAHDQINQAVLDYPQALLAVQSATEQVIAAQKAYNDAMAEGNTKQRDITNATDELRVARLQEAQAVEKVKQAEVDLARARQAEIDAVAAAQDQLTSDQNRLANDQQAIQAAQLKLTEDKASDGMLDLTKAVNALNDAYAKLHDSTMTVADAQYNLNYLLAEGASARDIADAQQQLTEAQNAQADAATGVTDAQNGLTEAQANSGAAQLAQDERDLSDAMIQVSQDQRTLTQDTNNLADARQNLADNSGVIDAEEALAQAQADLDKQQQQVKDDTIALKDARKETGADAQKQAEEGLTSALLQLAQAHVQVSKDLAEMNGQQFGAGRQARALSEELTKLGENAAGPVAANLRKMTDALSNSVSDIKVPTTVPGAGGGGGGGGGGFSVPDPNASAGKILPVPAPVALLPSPKGWLQDLWDDWSKLDVRIVGDVAQWGKDAWDAWSKWDSKIFGSLYDGFNAFNKWLGGMWSDAWHGLATGAKDGWQAVQDFFTNIVPNFFSGLWSHITDGMSEAWSAVDNFFSQTIPHTVAGIGDKITAPFKDAYNWVKEHWGDITGLFTKPVESAINWIKSHFSTDLLDIFKKPWDWVKSSWSDIKDHLVSPLQSAVDWIKGHFGDVTDALKKPWQWVKDSWSDIRDHLQTPLANAVDWIHNKFDSLVSWFGGLPGRITHAVKGMWDGITTAFRAAIDTVIGWWDAFVSHLKIPGFHVHISIPLAPDINFGWGGLDIGAGLYIPRLAEGGVATRAMLAMIGEGGDKEAILPLSQFAHLFAPVDNLAMQMSATNAAITALLNNLPSGGTPQGGDTFNITQTQADPMQIAEDIIFKKKVQLR